MSFVECKAGRFEGIFKDNCHLFNGIPYAKYRCRWDQSQLLEEEINIQAFEKGYSAPQTRFDDGQTGLSFFQDNSLIPDNPEITISQTFPPPREDV